ncbi:MAG: hypothetical protein HOB32_05175 [Nitrospina sp.]|jgi:hypothetical protein|nr:hypothetical protein [Nitrospina sp.]MBT6295050.1 hypothetical protein [Nitrospina sp.]MBT6601040.1 hypothetical protein [Nitrospina sp.]
MSNTLDHIYDLLKELRPCNITHSDRIRIGTPDNDGGYVLLNKRLEGIDVLYSYGVGASSDFENNFCEKYNSIARLYDHTVNKAPIERDFLHFTKEGVGPEKTENCNTIEGHITQNEDSNKSMILKMDVEGAEWDVLLQTPSATLELFEQIVIEIHFLHSVHPNYDGKNLLKPVMEKRTAILKKLNSLFYLYHVHAVNWSPLYYIDSFRIPNVLELTLVNKKHFESTGHSETIFPTKFDRPSWENRKDINLHFWPFYPGITQHISHIITQSHWQGLPKIIVLIYKFFITNWKSMLIKTKLRRPTSFT